MTYFVALLSGTGGVGKTTLAVNLGAALAGFGRAVIVIDANLRMPGISTILNCLDLPLTLHDVLDGKESINNVLYTHPCGLTFVPAHSSFERSLQTIPNTIEKVREDLFDKAELVLFDTPSGLGNETVELISAFDACIIVTTPELSSLVSSLKMIQFANQHHKKILGVVLTHVRGYKNELDKESIIAMLEQPIIGEITVDPLIGHAEKMGHPLVYVDADAPASISYKKLAAFLIGDTYKPSLSEQPKSFFERIVEKIASG